MFKTIAIAFSMFSALPMPQFEWKEKSMRYALVCFPLVGVLIGVTCILVQQVAVWLHLPNLLRGVLLCLTPVWLTGGIHLDGYIDTCDALASHASAQKKQEILKDPHVGAFSIIRLTCYLLLSVALWCAFDSYQGGLMLVGFVLSRTLSGYAVASFPLAKASGLAYTFATVTTKQKVSHILKIMAIVCSTMLLYWGIIGIAVGAVAWGVFYYYRYIITPKFGGLSGDLAGWFLQTAELWMLIAVLVMQYGGAK